MKNLVFYTDTIQGFSMGLMQSVINPLEYQGSNLYVEVKSVEEVVSYMSSITDIAHLEAIHILGVTPKVGAKQDELEAMLAGFSDVPMRFTYWASDYGEPIVNPSITYVHSTPDITIVDAYIMALTNNIANKELSAIALSYYWPIRAYLTHDYTNTTKEESEHIKYIHDVFGLVYVTNFGFNTSLEDFYNTHRFPLERYKLSVEKYVLKAKYNANRITIDDVTYVVLATDMHYNEVADNIMLYETDTNSKIAVIMLTVERNQTKLTIRTHNVDATEVGSMFSDKARGKYNATTVFLGAQITPNELLSGIKNMKEAGN